MIREWNGRLSQSITVRFSKTEDERSKDFEVFLDAFSKLAPRINFAVDRGESENLPALLIGDSWRFHLIPLGLELPPFLDLLNLLDKGQASLNHGIRQTLNNVTLPTQLTVFVSHQCTNCPNVVRQITPLPLINPDIKVTLIDGMLFSELAEADDIRAVPTVICDEQYRWTGQLNLEEVLDVLVHRNPDHLGSITIETMIKEGNAKQLADMMVQHDRIFSNFMGLLTHEKWPIRLGAMVVMEQITDQKPPLAKQALEPLWEEMKVVQETVRGDIIYLIGEIADQAWLPRMEMMLSQETNDDLSEALEEAVAKIRLPKRGHINMKSG